CVSTACTAQPEPNLLVRDDRAARSQAAVDEVVGRDTNPGCSAAVGERGEVLWRGHRGLALVEPVTPISDDTTFDVGAISQQFTALSVALLDQEGRLSVDDPLSKHLHGYPDWSHRVTISQLIHHTSGIPDIEPLMRARGVWMETEATRAQQLDAIADVPELEAEPGTRWAYSGSNYLLLGVVVEKATGRPLADHLEQTFFAPLALAISLTWPGAEDRTRSYRGQPDGRFEIHDLAWEGPGAAGIRTNPAELVRWADVYRTGAIGGLLVTEPGRDAVDGAWDGSDYGLGILIAPDQTLYHPGQVGGFRSLFGISADRQKTIAVSCNGVGYEPFDIVAPLIEIWAFR
ncbi:MAG TPA: serine hydrolase domain-containing protein, partial [Microlunatus sp.]|nr:serine hydrolase domain-containing protein [Microlunatus sp.]